MLLIGEEGFGFPTGGVHTHGAAEGELAGAGLVRLQVPLHQVSQSLRSGVDRKMSKNVISI